MTLPIISSTPLKSRFLPLRKEKKTFPFWWIVFCKKLKRRREEKESGWIKSSPFLIEYDWPGNVVELRNTLEGMVILSSGDLLTSEDIPDYIKKRQREELLGVKVGMSMEEVEKILIQETLKFTRFNKTRAANILGISLRTLYHKIEQYDLALERN